RRSWRPTFDSEALDIGLEDLGADPVVAGLGIAPDLARQKLDRIDRLRPASRAGRQRIGEIDIATLRGDRAALAAQIAGQTIMALAVDRPDPDPVAYLEAGGLRRLAFGGDDLRRHLGTNCGFLTLHPGFQVAGPHKAAFGELLFHAQEIVH